MTNFSLIFHKFLPAFIYLVFSNEKFLSLLQDWALLMFSWSTISLSSGASSLNYLLCFRFQSPFTFMTFFQYTDIFKTKARTLPCFCHFLKLTYYPSLLLWLNLWKDYQHLTLTSSSSTDSDLYQGFYSKFIDNSYSITSLSSPSSTSLQHLILLFLLSFM